MKKLIGAFLAILTWSLIAFGFEVPRLSGPVVDEARLLSPQEQLELSELIRSVHDKGIAQIQVAIIKSLGGEPIEAVSIKITDTWKLGDSKKDNGILFLIAVQDKKMRIEVGQGLEGDIPDVIARRILETKVQPFFRSGQFAQGIRSGLFEIIKRTDSSFSANGDQGLQEPTEKKNSTWMFFLYLIIFIIITLMRSSRSLPFGRRGWGSSSSGWGGGFGGGGSGGGWSGGGGGFSGGGSSSDW